MGKEDDMPKDTAVADDDKKTASRQEVESGEPKRSGGEIIKVSRLKLVEGVQSLAALASKPLTSPINYRVSKALTKVRKEVDEYNEDIGKIKQEYGGKPSPLGWILDEKSDKYLDGYIAVEEYNKNAGTDDIEMTGILLFTVDELLAALPAEVVRKNEGDSDSDVIEKKPRVEAFILADLDWLILPPENE